MVYAVYGNPPMRAEHDHDNDPNTPMVTDLTTEDEDVFKKLYDDLVAAEDIVPTTHLTNTPIQALLTRHLVATVDILDDEGMTVTGPGYTAVSIVHALANEIFDPPTGLPMGESGQEGTVQDDDDFDWPYRTDNGPATVADWWEHTDCRVMRIAVGEDNEYLDAAVGIDTANDGDFDDEGDTAPVDAETSKGGFCGHFPGSDMIPMDGEPISVAAQARVEVVGRALLGLGDDAGRPFVQRPRRRHAHNLRRSSSRVDVDCRRKRRR